MMIGGFPKRAAPPASVKAAEPAPAPAPVDAAEPEFDEEGRLLIRAPLAPPPRPAFVLHPQPPAGLPRRPAQAPAPLTAPLASPPKGFGSRPRPSPRQPPGGLTPDDIEFTIP